MTDRPTPDYTTSMRSIRCGDLRADDIGTEATLCGWVDSVREHGEHLAFVDLRDRSGVVQVVVDGGHELRSEFVLQVTGTVRARPEDTTNESLATGMGEVAAAEGTILARAEPPPFPIDDRTDVDEVLRLRHRYVDLRRSRLQRNLEVRATVNSAVRGAMEEQGFIEVETPMLIASTPEGARAYVVPSRRAPGSLRTTTTERAPTDRTRARPSGPTSSAVPMPTQDVWNTRSCSRR